MLLCTQKNGSINKILWLCIWEFLQNVLVNCCLQIVESLISSIMNKMEMLVLFVCLLFSIQVSCCLSWVFHGWERVTCRWIVTVCSCYPQTPVLHASSRFSWAFLLCMHHLIGFFKEKKAYPSHFSGNLHGRIQLLDNYRQPAKRFPNACLFFSLSEKTRAYSILFFNFGLDGN